MNVRLHSIGLVLAVGAQMAWAQGALSWDFKQTSFLVDPGTVILVSGVVSNASDSPQVVELTKASFSLGELQDVYTFSWMGDTLDGSPIFIHGTVHFFFGTLTPIGLAAPPGTYVSGPASLTFALSEPQTAGPLQIAVVPEPTVVTLGMLGLACVLMKRPLAPRAQPSDAPNERPALSVEPSWIPRTHAE